MPEWGSLLIAFAGFFALGHLFNYFSQSVYWRWADCRAQQEDAKMLKDQEKTAKNTPDNVVKLDDVRNKIIISDYNNDTIH
mgnify:CR=1 FL=1